jgi:hypothetical protein
MQNESDQMGPFEIDELKTKEINKDTPIWHDGLSDWTTAGKVDELKDLFKTKGQSPPPLNEIKTIQAPEIESFAEQIIPDGNIRKKLPIGWVIFICILALSTFGIFIYNPGNSKKSHSNVPSDKQDNNSTPQNNTSFDNNSGTFSAKEKTARGHNENEQKKLEQQEIERQTASIRNNWMDYITASRSSFTYREIGGIYDLYITVNNNTAYTIDEVSTTISYIKTNGDIYKTELVNFYNIPPFKDMTERAPDSDRGTSVEFLEIIEMKSADLNFCYSQGKWDTNSSDPYKCQ